MDWFLYDRDLRHERVYPLSSKPTKWSDTLKQFVGNLPTNCLSVFDHFVGLTLKELMTKRSDSFCKNSLIIDVYQGFKYASGKVQTS